MRKTPNNRAMINARFSTVYRVKPLTKVIFSSNAFSWSCFHEFVFSIYTFFSLTQAVAMDNDEKERWCCDIDGTKTPLLYCTNHVMCARRDSRNPVDAFFRIHHKLTLFSFHLSQIFFTRSGERVIFCASRSKLRCWNVAYGILICCLLSHDTTL